MNSPVLKIAVDGESATSDGKKARTAGGTIAASPAGASNPASVVAEFPGSGWREGDGTTATLLFRAKPDHHSGWVQFITLPDSWYDTIESRFASTTATETDDDEQEPPPVLLGWYNVCNPQQSMADYKN